MTNLIEIKHLTFQRGKRFIFDDVNIVIPEGKITAIMGPSGSGKTTLLRLIGAQLYPDSGSIFMQGKEINTLARRALFQLRTQMGLLFQNGGLFTHLTVFENVAFPLREHTTLAESMIRTLVLSKLQMVGLRGAHTLMPSELSGGMNRRVALARAIVFDPKLIMYDEPFSGQDPISMGVLVKLIRSLNDALGLTTILVSHDVSETLSIADYVYVMANGKVIGHGPTEEIKKDNSPELRQFIDGLPDGPVAFHYPSIPLLENLLTEGR
jgi:phospholipid/cholesterol/gamma-HCH transport system ATP-binding protein